LEAVYSFGSGTNKRYGSLQLLHRDTRISTTLPSL